VSEKVRRASWASACPVVNSTTETAAATRADELIEPRFEIGDFMVWSPR
jgi:hypothetical protein